MRFVDVTAWLDESQVADPELRADVRALVQSLDVQYRKWYGSSLKAARAQAEQRAKAGRGGR